MVRSCGSRTSATTCAPSPSSRRATQPPTTPVAPVTSTRLSRQNPLIGASVRPELPGRLAARPEVVEQPGVAQRVHALPEPGVAVGLKLALVGEALERLALEVGLVAGDVVEHGWLQDEVPPVDPAL